jgi:hypothetical protein
MFEGGYFITGVAMAITFVEITMSVHTAAIMLTYYNVMVILNYMFVLQTNENARHYKSILFSSIHCVGTVFVSMGFLSAYACYIAGIPMMFLIYLGTLPFIKKLFDFMNE